MPTLEEVTAEILQLEQETEGLLKRLVSFGEVERSPIEGLINERGAISIIYGECLFSINGSDNNDTDDYHPGRFRDSTGV